MEIHPPPSGGARDGATTVSEAAGRRQATWLGRLRSRLSVALGRPADRGGFVLREPPAPGPIGPEALIDRLASGRNPRREAALIAEAAGLLGTEDRRAIGDRLRADGPAEAGAPYADAVARLAERLAWVVVEESRGSPPPERATLGRVRFFGESPQEAAASLRLPPEVVERWARRAGLAERT